MLSEQRYGNVSRGQHLEVFKHWNTGCTLLLLLEEWKAVSCHFPSCHFQDQHLATSCTSCCCCCGFFSPSTDRWYKSFDNFPPSSKEVLLVWYLYKMIVCPCHSLYPVSRVRREQKRSSETFDSVLHHVLWRCLTETSLLLMQPFCSWGITPKRGRGREGKHWYLCLHENLGFLVMLSLYTEPRIGVLISLFPSLGFRIGLR